MFQGIHKQKTVQASELTVPVSKRAKSYKTYAHRYVNIEII